MAKRAKSVDLLRVVDLLQEHITPALCRTVFGAVRRTERQRVWTLEALVQFWTAVVLRAPTARALPGGWRAIVGIYVALRSRGRVLQTRLSGGSISTAACRSCRATSFPSRR
jgi:hypothetical protein